MGQGEPATTSEETHARSVAAIRRAYALAESAGQRVSELSAENYKLMHALGELEPRLAGLLATEAESRNTVSKAWTGLEALLDAARTRDLAQSQLAQEVAEAHRLLGELARFVREQSQQVVASTPPRAELDRLSTQASDLAQTVDRLTALPEAVTSLGSWLLATSADVARVSQNHQELAGALAELRQDMDARTQAALTVSQRDQVLPESAEPKIAPHADEGDGFPRPRLGRHAAAL